MSARPSSRHGSLTRSGFALVVAFGVAFGACTSSSDPSGSGGQPVSCKKNSDCPAGDACAPTGVCGKQCSADGDCDSYSECNGGACTAIPTGTGGGKSGTTSTTTGCFPVSCGGVGADCGTVPDGCGGKLDCGTCPSGQTCGGGGLANLCGAVATCVTDSDCTQGDTCCNGTCTSLLEDPNNCGACSATCPPGRTCTCLPGQSCTNGICN